MADEVRIESSQANEWAKQETLRLLLKETEVTNTILDKYVESVLNEDQIKALREQTDVMRDGFRRFDLNTDDVAEGNADLSQSMDSLNRTERDLYYKLSDVTDQLSSTFNRLDRIMGGDHSSVVSSFGDTLKNAARQYHHQMSPALTTLALKAGLLAEIFSNMWDRVTNLATAVFDAYSTGVVFTGGMNQLNNAVAASGLTLEKFSAIMNKNSSVVATLGVQRTVALSKSFQNLTRRGVDLGMSVEEAQQTLFDYADTQRVSGRLRFMTDQQITTGTIAYGKTLNDIAQITGKRRDQISEEIKQATKSADMQVILNSLGDKQREALLAGIAEFQKAGDSAGDLKDMTVRYMSRGFAGLTQQQRLMLQQSGQQAKFDQYVRAIMNKDTATSTRLLREMGEGFRSTSGRLSVFASADGPIGDTARGLATFSANVQSVIDAQGRMTEREIKDAQDTMAAMNEMNAAMGSLSASLTKIALPIVRLLVPAFEGLAKVVQYVTSLFGVGDVSPESQEAPASIMSMSFLGTLVGSVIAIIGSVWVAKIAGWVIKSLVSGGAAVGGGLLSRTLGMPRGPTPPGLPDMGGAARGAGAMGGIARGFAGLGRGVGSVISSVMEGIAKGFAAFGNPRVLLGVVGIAGIAGSIWIAAKGFQELAKVSWEDMGKAGTAIVGLGIAAAAAGAVAPAVLAGGAAIGAAIAAIGAGLAGAAWLMDKTLDGLVDGIKRFNEINGDNLITVSKGMLALSGSLVTMGGGSVVNAFTGLGTALFKFFSGEEDPIERLKRFGELAEPLNKAIPALDRFSSSFKNAVDLLNDSAFSPNVQSTMDQLKELLTTDAGGWFGGNPVVIDQLNDLASAIGNVADKTVNLQNAAGRQPAIPETAAIDMQKKTVAFYENQRESNASMISLLQAANTKLDAINVTVKTGADDTVRTIKRNNGSIYP